MGLAGHYVQASAGCVGDVAALEVAAAANNVPGASYNSEMNLI